MGPYRHERTEYDDEPVCFCRSCHSLDIRVDETLADVDWDGSYCVKCHSTDIGQCSVEEWVREDDRLKEVRRRIEWNR